MDDADGVYPPCGNAANATPVSCAFATAYSNGSPPVQIGSSAADEAQAQAIAQEQAAQTQAGIGMVGDAMMMFGDPTIKGAGLVIKGLSGLFGGGK